jgi:hypothetical protein
MSEKQRNCINWICDVLGVTYYGGDNKSDAWKFINKFMDRAKEVQKERNFYSSWGLSFFFGRSI